MLNIDTTQKETGTFKISVRQEGYHSSGFTRNTVVDDFYLVGKGPLSATELVEEIFWPIIKQVSHDYTDPSRVLTSEFADAMPVQHPDNQPVATTATEGTYKSYDADTEFNIYFFEYDDVTISKDRCTYGEGMGWKSPSKKSLHEAAEHIENEVEKKRQGLRKKDYRRHKPRYRPPVGGIEFTEMRAEEETRFSEAHSEGFGLKALELSEIVHEDNNWEPEIISSVNEPDDIKPAISWQYTGRVDHCGIPSESPGFTIVAIPQLEEFIIETKTIRLKSSKIKENDLPIAWNVSGGTQYREPRKDPRGVKYRTGGGSQLFVESESDAIKVIEYILNNFEEHLNEKSYHQIVKFAHGVGDKTSASLRYEFENFEELSNASKEDLKEIDGIGDKTATNIMELIENRV